MMSERLPDGLSQVEMFTPACSLLTSDITLSSQLLQNQRICTCTWSATAVQGIPTHARQRINRKPEAL